MPAKHRFATLISLLLIVGFLATSLVSYTVSVTLLKRGLSESILPLTGDNIYSEIQKDLVRPIFIASMMASDTFLRDWVLAGEQDVGRMTRYLAEVKSKYQTITSFFVSDRSYIYYHAEGILKQVSPEEPRDVWYYRVRSMDAPYELNVDRDMANRDAMTIFINHQVHDYDGNYIGATGCGLSVSSVTQLLAAYEQRYRRHIFFVDAKGMVTFSANNDRLPTILDQIEGLREIAPTILKQEHGSFSYERDGQTFIVDTRYVKELGWYLLVEQSLAPEMEMLRRTLLINLALGLIIGLIILVVVQRTISHYQCRLERLATSDKLTGLFNRHSGETLFQQALSEATRNALDLSVILLDIDHFKAINDRFGHQAGDLVLIACSRLIQSCLRESDIVCRWGGEEFLVVLKCCNLDAAWQLAEKIRTTIERETVVWGVEEISVQASLGVVQRHTGEPRDQLLARADQTMYRAKHLGRNRTEKDADSD
nr:sensor domain-containing diguanylate cyclase [uncultured Desulfobulbus sp.]